MFISDLYVRVEALNLEKVAADTINSTKEQLLSKNREQLLEGKRRDGKDITPSYLDDPYFKSRASAARYSAWKDKITPNPLRKSGTPNLFITGLHHRTIKLDVLGFSTLKFYGAYRQIEIEGKFSDYIYGLNANKRITYLSESLRPAFNKEIEKLTGLKFT